jgi:DNA-binding transcriptional LysR family regulator
VGGSDQRLSGVVRLATVDDFAVTLLPPLLAQFRRRHPGVVVELSIRTEFESLARKEADVALRFGGRPKEPDVVAREVCRVDVALYGAKSYLKHAGVPKRPEDWGRFAWVRGGPRLAHLDMERLVTRHVPDSAWTLRTDSMLVRYASVRDGLGLGFLPCFMANEDRRLVPLPFDLPEASSSLWLVVHVDLRTNARVRAFVDVACEELGKKEASFRAPER